MRLVFKRGRWALILWAPVRITRQYDDRDGWHMLGWAWMWRRPKRWRFPHSARASHCPTLQRGITFGPFDLRLNRKS